MSMKKWLTGVAVLTFGATLAVAAPHDGMGRSGRHGKSELGRGFAQKLNLTDAQKQQIRDLQKSFREQNKAFFQSSRQTMQEYRAAKKANDTAKADSLKGQVESQRAQMRQLRAQLDQRIATVLTPEQNAQWQQLKAERAAKRDQWKQKKQNR
jgi:Spy/CpxP family protein refolding chaperone